MFQRLKNVIAFARAGRKKRELTSVVPVGTFIAGTALMNALLNRQHVCTRCFNIYSPHERAFAERFHVRSILMLPDKEPDPMLCSSCFDSIYSEFNRVGANIGTSNSAPQNLVLKELH